MPSGVYGAEEVEEIVVMAQRRAESIQEVPLAVSAFTGTFVRDTHLDNIKDLVKYTPGMTGDSKDSFIDTLSIRGIITNDFGVGGDPSVGVFKNNLYQGRNGEVVTTPVRRRTCGNVAWTARVSVRSQFDCAARSACSRSGRNSAVTTAM